MERAAFAARSVCNARIYFDEPEELAPEPVLEPMPLLPEPELLVSELELPVLGELELGEALEPLEDEEPLAVPCSCRQRSFSVPVRLSHWVLPAPTEGEVVLLELPLALGEVVLPLVDDESAAMATAEAANSAVTAAVESTFNIVASPLRVREEAAVQVTQLPCLQRGLPGDPCPVAVDAPAPEPMPVLSGPELRADSALSCASFKQRCFASPRSDSHCLASTRRGGGFGPGTPGPALISLPGPCAKLTLASAVSRATRSPAIGFPS